MKSFNEFYNINKTGFLGETKKVVVTFGRFNPPTKGHEKLINVVTDLAEMTNSEHMIIPSRTHDTNITHKNRNPLPHDVKIGFMKRMFPNVNIVSEAPSNPWLIPEWLGNQGFTDVSFVVGHDQIQNFSRLAESMKNIFNSFNVVDAGMRLTESVGVEGMSATKARQAAVDNDIGNFRVATGWSGEIASQLMEAIQMCMCEDCG